MKNGLNIKLLISILVIFLILSSTHTYAINTTSNEKNYEYKLKQSDLIKNPSKNAKWTVMMYLAFDNYRYDYKDYTLDALKEVGSDDNINIVALFDGKEIGDTSLFYVENNNFISLPWNESESNLGQPKTLKQFLNYSIQTYTADHLALFILSTHGSSWQGLGCDYSGGTTLSLLDMKDYQEVLGEITKQGADKIDVLGFNICLTAGVEVAFQIAPYVNYMIANEDHALWPETSEEGTPLEFNFSKFLYELKNNPNVLPESFAISAINCLQPGTYELKILDRWKAPKWFPIAKIKTDLSVINLSEINNVGYAIKQLVEKLNNYLIQGKIEIKKARDKSREYGKMYRKFWFSPHLITYGFDSLGYDCFIDIYDFVFNLKNVTSDLELISICNNVMQLINTSILENKCLPHDVSHGIHIYFPQLKCQYDISIWLSWENLIKKSFINIYSYEELSFSKYTSWDVFIKSYLNIKK